MVHAYLTLILNFLISFVATSVFYPIILTKDYLASKTNFNRNIDLSAKAIIPVLNLFAPSNVGI